MITVKPLKQTTQQKQTTRENFSESNPQRKNFVPLAFLLFLTACAGYLKSFLPVHLEAHDERPSHPNGETEKSDPDKDDIVGSVDADPDGKTRPAAKSSDTVAATRILIPSEFQFVASDGGFSDIKDLTRTTASRVDAGLIGEVGRPTENRQSTPVPSGGGVDRSPVRGGSDSKQDQPAATSLNPSGGTPPNSTLNRAPRTSGPVHLPNMMGCQAFLIPLLALLSGASDADGDALTVIGLSSSVGTLTQNSDGGWEFVHDRGALGDVTLTYTISDGRASVVQTAYFSIVEAAPIIGTNADDTLLGTHCADVIDARDGDDNIDAREGADSISGGAGDDHIVAGAGDDIVYAGTGNDIVFAGSGNDIVFGGSGNDRIFGEEGDDTLIGESGDDFLSGGLGNDILLADAGNDVVDGGEGNDMLAGGEGNDDLSGGIGNDLIFAGSGDDVVDGGAGDDILWDGIGSDAVRGGAGNDYVMAAADSVDDVYAGDAGSDTLDYSASYMSVVIDVGAGKATGADIGNDRFTSFEKIIGGSGNDRLIAANMGDVTMTGGAGRDTFEFQRSDSEDRSAMTVRKITDFTVGDRIVASTYAISYFGHDGAEAVADLFDDIYSSNEVDNRPVRFRFDHLDADGDVTFVDVHDRRGSNSDAPDADDFYSIEVMGHHQLLFTVAVV